MSANEWREALQRFAPQFFGPGNRLRWANIERATLAAATLKRIEPWIADLRAGRDPLILPRVRDDDSVDWYAFSRTDLGARALREHLVAFLGPSYSEFEGFPGLFDTNDPVELAILEIAKERAFRVRIPDSKLRSEAHERLLLLREMLAERPNRASGIARPTGRILGDFELALRNRDGEAAASHIEELQRLGRISAQNHLFVEVLRWEALEDWCSITNPSRLALLVDLPRPRRITRALVRGIYYRELHHFESSLDPAGAIEHFRNHIFQRYAMLFRTRAGMDAPEITKSFLLLAAAVSPPRIALRDELLASHAPDAPDRAFVEALAALVPTSTPTSYDDPLTSAKAAFDEGDVDRAFHEALALAGGTARLALLLRCARELDTLDAAAVALQAVDSAPKHERAALLERAALRAIWERLMDLATAPTAATSSTSAGAPQMANDVLTWLERLRDSEPWSTATEVIERGAHEWSRAEWLHNKDRVFATARALSAARPPWGEEALRTCVPHLLTFFLNADPPERTLKPILIELATILALDDDVRFEQLRALSEIVGVLVRIGLSPGEYNEAMAWIRDTWTRLGAASLGDWALDTLDMLIEYPAADPLARESFFYDVSNYLRRHFQRTTREQRALLAGFAAELGAQLPPDLTQSQHVDAEPDVTSTGDALAAALAGRRVALYSLKHSVLDRVAKVLMEVAPNVQVACFHDKVGGAPALKHQATTADVFVVATAAAKHAATEFIAAHRPTGALTLFAAGQGSASMLRALRHWAATTTQ